MRCIELADGKSFGDGRPVFIVAEVGANHNRSMSLAGELIDAAAEAGVDGVKFQFYTPDGLYSSRTPMHSGYEKDLHTLISEIETPREWAEDLAARCRARGVTFFGTPFDRGAADMLARLSPMIKIASFELVDLPFVRYAAEKGKPMVLSTGMASSEEIGDAIGACRAAGNEAVALLQCASLYPSPPEIMNLRAIPAMRAEFGVPAGLSDHSEGGHVALAAVAMGACMIEKHFTLSRKMDGPDHHFAMEPDDMRTLVRQCREIEAAMGDGLKSGPDKAESEYYGLRRSVHAAVDIPAGAVITLDMLTVKRPALGVPPKSINTLAGMRARRNIAADEWISWDDAE
ncbi:MAG: N-acetylneuraminate synthase family protein [Synergistaceae bacterium]|jgi:sialic acid synthase SpsE|nr:N-acetylneuraminate synthase family protein [Synergistaceae bacterium]